jgi:Ni2+-binding GTPase involved in maturation of urease and hydrogenase
MSINTEEPVHILLIGPPASAKTMFIKSMMMKLDNPTLLMVVIVQKQEC